MLQGLSANVTGINAYKNSLITSANNIANINTPSFKSNSLHLSELKNGGVQVSAVSSNNQQGYLIQSGRTLDFAIQGDGYFKLQGDDGGDYFTRKGNFYVDGEGSLVDERGRTLVEDVVDVGDKLSIEDDGGILVNGERVGEIPIFDNNGNRIQQDRVDLRSGALEASNVDYAREIVNMMVSQNAMKANITSARTHDDLLGLIVNLKG